MPLDQVGFELPVEIEPFKNGREGLAQLSAALRREMPPRFKWLFNRLYDQTDCGSAGCALGLCKHLWPEEFAALNASGHYALTMARVRFGIETDTDHVCACIFQTGSYPVPDSHVTPVMVADRIDHWLATGEIR